VQEDEEEAGSEEEDDEDEDDEDDEEDEDDDDEGEEEEEEGQDVDHAGLLQMVEGLAGKGSKGSDAERLMAMELQNMPDSAFNTGTAQGLTLEAMLASLKVRV
jgi:ABC-type Zn2+ transport system substrate-binding protein/surface adhesin